MYIIHIANVTAVSILSSMRTNNRTYRKSHRGADGKKGCALQQHGRGGGQADNDVIEKRVCRGPEVALWYTDPKQLSNWAHSKRHLQHTAMRHLFWLQW